MKHHKLHSLRGADYEAAFAPPQRRPVTALGFSLLWMLHDEEDRAVDLVLVPKDYTAPRLRALRETE